jgi:hypothetical protein
MQVIQWIYDRKRDARRPLLFERVLLVMRWHKSLRERCRQN